MDGAPGQVLVMMDDAPVSLQPVGTATGWTVLSWTTDTTMVTSCPPPGAPAAAMKKCVRSELLQIVPECFLTREPHARLTSKMVGLPWSPMTNHEQEQVDDQHPLPISLPKLNCSLPCESP